MSSAPLSDATNSPLAKGKKPTIFSKLFSGSKTTKPVDVKAPPSEPVFFAIMHEFVEGKADEFWAVMKGMKEDDLVAMTKKHVELGFFNHSFMPTGETSTVLCLWEAKPETTTESMQSFIDGPDGPGPGVFVNTVHKVMPGAIVPASVLASPAAEPSKSAPSKGSFFWVYHTFKDGAAEGFWESMGKMTPDDLAAMGDKNVKLGFHNHAFLPCAPEGPCVCIWESSQPMTAEAFQAFIDGPDGPGAGAVFDNKVHAAIDGAILPSAKFPNIVEPTFYAAWQSAFESKDVDAVSNLYTEDCTWVWHSSGKTMGKEAFVAMMPTFMKMPPATKPRCVYENAEICVFHAFNRFPSGDVEGTLMSMKLRDGKCYSVETGSTPIPKDSPNYIEG